MLLIGAAGRGGWREALRTSLDARDDRLPDHKFKKQSTPVADSGYTAGQLFSPHELAREAEQSAVDLLERLLISFVPEEVDVLKEAGWTA